MVDTAVENLAIKLLSRLCEFILQGIHNNPCKQIGILIVDEDVEFAISKQKQLKLKTVRLALNVRLRFRPAFL